MLNILIALLIFSAHLHFLPPSRGGPVLPRSHPRAESQHRKGCPVDNQDSDFQGINVKRDSTILLQHL